MGNMVRSFIRRLKMLKVDEHRQLDRFDTGGEV